MSLGPGRSGRRNGPQVEQRNWTKGSKNTWATHNVLDKMPHTMVGKAKRAHHWPFRGGHGAPKSGLPDFGTQKWVEIGNSRFRWTRLCPPYIWQTKEAGTSPASPMQIRRHEVAQSPVIGPRSSRTSRCR